ASASSWSSPPRTPTAPSARCAPPASPALASSAGLRPRRTRPPPSATKADRTLPVSFRRVTPESILAAFVVAAAAVMAAGYLVDAVGLAMSPVFLALVAAAGGAGAFLVFGETADDRFSDRGTLVLFVAVVLIAFAYFLWLASPSLLPVTNGPDIVHHLLLIHLIQRTHHLVHDPALSPYLLEMM